MLELSDPCLFFECLKDWKILDLFFPELTNLVNIPQSKKYHPEGDCWIHTMNVLKASCLLSESFSVRFASLIHDLGKGLTPKDILPKHIGHESRGITLVEEVTKRFKIDAYTRKLSLCVCKNHLKVHRIFELKASTLHDILIEFNAFREGPFFTDILHCCHADFLGKQVNIEIKNYPQKTYIRDLANRLNSQTYEHLTQKYTGSELGDKIRRERIMTIKEYQSQNSQNIEKER